MVIGVLTRALLHSMCDLKAVRMNMQSSLIWELMLYKFEVDYNAVVATKKIYCVKDEGTVDYSTITSWLKKFHLGCVSECCNGSRKSVSQGFGELT